VRAAKKSSEFAFTNNPKLGIMVSSSNFTVRRSCVNGDISATGKGSSRSNEGVRRLLSSSPSFGGAGRELMPVLI